MLAHLKRSWIFGFSAFGRRALAATYAVFWCGGVFSYLAWGQPPEDAKWAAPVFLALAMLFALAFSQAAQRPWLLWAGAVGFASEVAGVAWGVPFGGYRYTEVLAPRWLDVPLVLFSAWIALAAYVRERLGRTAVKGWWRSAAGAAWMTALDLVIDPPAAGPLGYWVWDSAGAYYGIPFSNFVGWFAVSLLIFWPARGAAPANPALRALGASIVLFFAVIAFRFGQWGAGVLGLGLLALDCAVARRSAPQTA